MRFHLLFYVLLFTFYVLIALLGFSSISLAQEDTWIRKADMPTARWLFSTSVVNGKIYAIGGELRGQVPNNPSTTTSIVEVYDPVTDTWTRKADMPTARWTLSTSVVNSKIYAIGGTPDDVIHLSTVEEYDPATDTWTKKADMPTGRSRVVTEVVNGKIYAIGGSLFQNVIAISVVEVYDPTTDTWTKKADMPTPRMYFSTGVVNGKIYAMGGWSASQAISTIEVYDPATDTWTKKADMPTPRSRFSTSVVNGKIYAIGGVITFGIPTEAYDPVADTWTRKTDMPTGRAWLSTSVVNGFIYAIGGSLSAGASPLSTVEAYDTGVGVGSRVTVISSLAGSIAGGELLVISGSGFPPGTSVTIGEKPLTDMKVTPTLITGLTPPGTAGEQDIWLTITVPGLDYPIFARKFRYILPSDVVLTGMTPTQGKLAGGDTGSINGRGFQQGARVTIGGIGATNVAVTPTLIAFTIPPGKAGKADVVVTNSDGQQDILRGAFTYVPPPTIKEVSPIFVPLSGFFKEIQIKGSGFIRTPNVQIGRAAPQRVDFISSDELNVLTGRVFAVGPQDVIVTNPDGQRAILSGGVTVLAPIKIKSVEPNSGGLAGGTKITIVGEPTVEFLGKSYPSRFVEGAEVIIGKEKASDVTVVSDNIITAITPPNTPGLKDVKVVNVDGQADTFDDGFSYNPLPQIIKVIPNNGPLSGGTKIRIQGSKFLPGAKVLIGDVDANSYIVAPAPEVASDAFITAITPKVPLDEPGPRDVIVVNADGQEVVLRDGFTYNPLPTIRDLSPSYGPSSGGTKVIIRGTGFLQGARVIIGKRFATTEFKDDETIEAVTPANPKGRLDVRVVNPDTQEAIIPRAFISVGELAYNYPNPFQASRGTTFRYVPGPNESVESIVVRIFNLAGVPIGVVGQEGSNEVRWQDSRVNVGLYVYMMEVRVGGKVKQFKRMLEVYK